MICNIDLVKNNKIVNRSRNTRHSKNKRRFQVLYSRVGDWPYPSYYFMLETLARNKHSTLLGPIVRYEENKVL